MFAAARRLVLRTQASQSLGSGCVIREQLQPAAAAAAAGLSTFQSLLAPSRSGGSNAPTIPVTVDENPDPQHNAQAPSPKRARSAYNFFSSEVMQKTRKPGMKHADVMREIGAKWKGMSDAEKARELEQRRCAACMLRSNCILFIGRVLALSVPNSQSCQPHSIPLPLVFAE